MESPAGGLLMGNLDGLRMESPVRSLRGSPEFDLEVDGITDTWNQLHREMGSAYYDEDLNNGADEVYAPDSKTVDEYRPSFLETMNLDNMDLDTFDLENPHDIDMNNMDLDSMYVARSDGGIKWRDYLPNSNVHGTSTQTQPDAKESSTSKESGSEAISADEKSNGKENSAHTRPGAKATTKPTTLDAKKNSSSTKPDVKNTRIQTKPEAKKKNSPAKSDVKKTNSSTKPEAKNTNTAMNPDLKLTSIQTKPDAKKNNKPTKPNVKGTSTPIKLDTKITTTPSKPNIKKTSTHTKPTMKETSTPAKPNVKDTSTPTKPNVKETSKTMKSDVKKVSKPSKPDAIGTTKSTKPDAKVTSTQKKSAVYGIAREAAKKFNEIKEKEEDYLKNLSAHLEAYKSHVSKVEEVNRKLKSENEHLKKAQKTREVSENNVTSGQNSLAKTLDHANSKIGDLLKHISKITAERDGIKKDLDSAHKKISAHQQEIKDLKQKISGGKQKKPLFMKQSEREAFLEESKPRFEDKEDVDAGLLHQALESRAIPDKKTVIKILTNRTRPERLKIAEAYKKNFGKELITSLSHRLHGNFRNVCIHLVWKEQNIAPLAVWCAIKGLGTHESVLIEIFCTSDSKKINEINNNYSKLLQFKRYLLGDVRRDTSGQFRRFLTAVIGGSREQSIGGAEQAKDDAKRLRELTAKEWSLTNEFFFTFFTQRSFHDIRQTLTKEWPKLSKDKFADLVEARLRGDAQQCIKTLVLYTTLSTEAFYATVIRDCLATRSIDHQRFIYIISTLNDVTLGNVIKEYNKKFGVNLEDQVKARLSDYYQEIVLAILQSAHK